jgi:hypothetical protein
VATYEGGGYVVPLFRAANATLATLQSLNANSFLDVASRALFVDLTVYNGNINLFMVVRLLFEFPPSGGVLASANWASVKLLRYVTTGDFVIAAFEVIFFMFIVYFTFEEIIEIRILGVRYFKSVWNWLDLINIALAIVTIGFNLYRLQEVNNLLSGLIANQNAYANFTMLGFWQTQMDYVAAVNLFFVWIKIFKYMSFNKTMTQLSRTLSESSKDLFGFAVLFFLVFFAYAQLGYLLFGTVLHAFSTFGNSCFTLFLIILGEFDFTSIESANRILGPIFFTTYVFFVFFVLFNMFIAIINEAYMIVKERIKTEEDYFPIAKYVRRRYLRALDRVLLKKQHVDALDAALKNADGNADNVVDADELRRQGLGEAEIASLMRRFDRDATGNLDASEQGELRRVLEKKRQTLNRREQQLREEATTVAAAAGTISGNPRRRMSIANMPKELLETPTMGEFREYVDGLDSACRIRFSPMCNNLCLASPRGSLCWRRMWAICSRR